MDENIIVRITNEFNLKKSQTVNIIKLIDEGNTIPFIARYRKEMTGELNDQVLREFSDRLAYLRNLDERRQEVTRLISGQGNLTPEVERKLTEASTLQEVEDIYRPFRPKRRTRASIARERGLAPLADIVYYCNIHTGNTKQLAMPFIDENSEVKTVEDALNGACDIIAEDISDNPDYRKKMRDFVRKNGIVETKALKDEDSVYRMYYDYRERVSGIAGHRVLAINRGEKEGFLKVSIDIPREEAKLTLEDMVFGTIVNQSKEVKQSKEERLSIDANKANKANIANIANIANNANITNITNITNKTKNSLRPGSITDDLVRRASDDAFERLIFPSLEREIRNEITEEASEQALKVFSVNLKNLLMQPPVRGKKVLGLDPAYRTGCKTAVVDETGKLLEVAVVYPTPPQNKTEEAKRILSGLIKKYNIEVISIGNGTASKETEIFTINLIKEIKEIEEIEGIEGIGGKITCLVVNEAGASVYSASKLGAQEFPEFDVSLRSAVSIARRLQDPLAELVKIEPKAIGVGQYQHDMNQKRLDEALGGVVEDCVNKVGVDLNTASVSLLSYISGINQSIAKNIVEYREITGAFSNRKELMKVKKLGEKAFEQCAGFLRIPGGKEVFDNTSVHPEAYETARKLMSILGYTIADINTGKAKDAVKKAHNIGLEILAEKTDTGIPTLRDILEELSKPGRDPREEKQGALPVTEILDINDLKPGMMLSGTVRNVAAFGAFVDIGVHQDGLIHVSELADRFVKNPSDEVAVGDIVTVRVISVDVERKRISLSRRK